MPLIGVTMTPGRSPAQKEELISRLTDTFLEVCGHPGQSKDGVWVILEEVSPAHWGTGGRPMAGKAPDE